MGSLTLSVMLTHNDRTVPDALAYFQSARHISDQVYWGMKDVGIPPEELLRLHGAIKDAGKTTCYEIMATEEDALKRSVTFMCEQLKPDYLIHTKYHPFIQQATDAAGIRYMPALGTSINGLLHGEIDAMVEEAKTVAATGVYGVKVSAYRYVGNSQALVEALMRSIHCPLCATGSVDSFPRIQVLKDSGVALFTIGSALFNHKFGGGFAQQIQAISAFLNQ